MYLETYFQAKKKKPWASLCLPCCAVHKPFFDPDFIFLNNKKKLPEVNLLQISNELSRTQALEEAATDKHGSNESLWWEERLRKTLTSDSKMQEYKKA